MTESPQESFRDSCSADGGSGCRVNPRQNPQQSPSRRRFLSVLVGGIGALMSVAMGVPVLGYLLAPVLKKSAKRWIEVGPLDGFSSEPKSAKINYTIEDSFRPVNKSMRLWVMMEAGNPVVFSTYCTHLGCTVSWKPDNNHFFCPCHDGVFGRDGAVISGPPPRPLDRLNAKVEHGKIMVEV